MDWLYCACDCVLLAVVEQYKNKQLVDTIMKTISLQMSKLYFCISDLGE